jgi:cytochrome c oxidase accessory protein FixG
VTALKPEIQKPTASEAPQPAPVLKDVNWQDFREHLATADQQGNRKWIYAKKPSGRFHRLRTGVAWLLIGIMFTGPFIKIDGNPLLLFNIVERKFSILGRMFWPQDIAIFAVAMLIFLTGIVFFTTAFGRLWCGWTCPQTVMMEFVFRKLEYLIEGDAHQQRTLDAAPWSAGKVTRKALKHGVFFGLSFIIGNTLLSYIIGVEALFKIIADNPLNHLVGLTFMILFTLLFYAIFARFREQACTFICPYGRLQSTLLDENSIVVAYDHKRGEKRGHLLRDQSTDARRQAGCGDCIDCHQCVVVCPTGIDIRNGTQMECVNCTACIDACDNIMDKVGRPRGLIRYASLNGIEHGQRLRVTPRMIGYSAVLLALIAFFLFLVFTRSPVETTLLRAPGQLFQQMPDGRIGNLYTLKLINKTTHDMDVQLKVENVPASLRIMGREPHVPAGQLVSASVLIELDASLIKEGRVPLSVGLYSGAKKLETVKTVFIGPRNQQAAP